MKINGVRYFSENNGKVFDVKAGERSEAYAYKDLNGNKIINNENGKRYYDASYKFRERLRTGDLSIIGTLKTSDAVDKNGKHYNTTDNPSPYSNVGSIFKDVLSDTGTYIEDEESDFNLHRREVIKEALESNLNAAISNFNEISTAGVNFAMPRLTEQDWDELTTRICMITFLQGLPIGGKLYNGYSIVPNDVNDTFVSDDSIYIASSRYIL